MNASWSLALRLARRELRGGIAGFRIFLACLALGVAAIAGVGSLSQALLTGLAADGRAVLGGDVSLRLVQRPASETERAHLQNSGALSEVVTLRAMARSADAAKQNLVELKAVDGAYPLAGALLTDPQLSPTQLFERRDGVWGAAVEAGLLDRLALKIGDRLRLGDAELAVRAVVAAEPDRADGNAGYGLGPRLMIGLAALPDTGLIQPGSQAVWQYRLQLPQGVGSKTWIAALNQAFPDAGWRARDVGDAAPGLKQFIDRATLFLTLVGLTALLVGGVGVGNAVQAYLGGKTAVIATLKCLGAPTTLVVRVYLLQILALSALGIAIGLIFGAVAPFAAAAFIGDRLPVDARFALYPKPLVLAAAFGFLTALTFSLWPVARAGELPAATLFRSLVAPADARPRLGYILATGAAAWALAALAILSAEEKLFALWFVLGTIAALLLFRGAGTVVMRAARRLRGVRRPGLRLALANLHRPGAVTPSVVLSLGLGLTLLVAIATIEGNMRREVTQVLSQAAPSLFLLDIQPDQLEPFRQLAQGFAGVTRVETVPMLRGRIASVNRVDADTAPARPEGQWALRGDRGITWSVAPPANSTLVAGAWWPADYRGEPLISLDAGVAGVLGLKIGDRLGVNVLGRMVEGRITSLRRIDWGTLAINFVIVFSPGVLDNAPQTNLATVYARPEVELALEHAIVERFPNVSTIRVKEALDALNKIVADIGLAVRLVAAVALAAGVLVLTGAIAAGHSRRVYDAVMLKVLGARRRNVLASFLIEYGLLGFVTAAISGLLGTAAASSVLEWAMKLDWVFLPGVAATTAIGATLLTLGLGFLGTWRALGQKPAPLLRND
ncbi:MAG: FtsX-like permease family protein [Alphaproteobacteria bacterium]|nr:FtsX-like permease family protein [Alphaproteobacteria bacterium]